MLAVANKSLNHAQQKVDLEAVLDDRLMELLPFYHKDFPGQKLGDVISEIYLAFVREDEIFVERFCPQICGLGNISNQLVQ